MTKIGPSFYFSVLKNMLFEELIGLKKVFLDQVINVTIWVVCTLVVSSYLMTNQFGIPSNFSTFMLCSCIASAGLFESYPAIFKLVSDFVGEKSISYYLTLPVPSWLVIVKIMIYLTLRAAIFSFIILPIGAIFIWNQFDIFSISWIKFFVTLFLSSSFFGSFTLWVTSYVEDLSKLEIVWIRFIFPLWFLGGFQFSWQALNKINPYLSYAALANPMLHVMESMRAAIIGQEGNFPFWISSIFLLVTTILSCCQAIIKIKKRLDFV